MNFLENKTLANELMNTLGEQSFVIKPGKGKVMFSAPHAVEQTRRGKIKYSEPQTGLLVEMLHNELLCC